MNWNWKNTAFLSSLLLNFGILAGYLYGTINPSPVQSSTRKIAPGLRDPNLTAEQIKAIKNVQANRRVWLENFQDRYRDELLAIMDLLDTNEPNWTEVNRREENLLKLRRDYQQVQAHSWSDIRKALTPEQGTQYVEALREIVRSSDFGHNATLDERRDRSN